MVTVVEQEERAKPQVESQKGAWRVTGKEHRVANRRAFTLGVGTCIL